ncbi:YfiT family bacillithiol transferase [Flavobacterium suncheonense]|uniref:DinB-like domain-containing protein n=1 Tax=Flavobacterium suncheonense GH29-5 = DSM 17707 TaxID=1121899 RepID=A0A0A2MDF8_9FLAO|nr:putative metal-dependent hydrolase [Flavobacterium suncheonense]KGO90319.1 hypothetical protein Q764_01860 [Flavobacterium suncheonense GH29-5 = DSM 17707]
MQNTFDLEALQFPIGRFSCPTDIRREDLEHWKTSLREFPAQLNAVLQPLTPAQLNWHYRPEGWTIKQVVHHLADSHINAFTRLKLTLTEDAPVIRPYEEALWAQLPDGVKDDLTASLKIIEGIHERWFYLLNHLTETEWDKMYFHPQHQRLVGLKEMLGLYDWHGRHHLAHIRQAIFHEGNFNVQP